MLDQIPNEKRKCHRCNFEKSCRELVLSGACERWTNVKGPNPQAAGVIDQWACMDDLQYLLLLHIGNQSSKVSAEINVLRNEAKKAHDEHVAIAAIAVQRSTDAVNETFSKTLIDFLPRQQRLLENQ